MIPAIVFGYFSLWNNRMRLGPNLFVLAVLGFLAIQFLPIAVPNSLPVPPEGLETLRLWSISPSRSLESAVFAISIIGFGLFVSTFRFVTQISLLRFIFLGLVINIAIAVVQRSYSGNTWVEGVLPFSFTTAMFANRNHFSTLIFMLIPLFAWRFLAYEQKPLVYLVIVSGIVFFLLVIGSQAGIGLSASLAVFCLVFHLIPSSDWKKRSVFIAMLLLSGVIVSAFFGLEALNEDSRLATFINTISAISGNWIFGTGLGSFPLVYPGYEPLSELSATFANHVHNDYLELVLEGGLAAMSLILVFIVLVCLNFFNTTLSQAAGLAVGSVLIHNLVDYPLRTMAVATIFAAIAAMLFSQAEPVPDSARNDRYI